MILFQTAPSMYYHPTNEIAWIFGRDDTDKVLAQKWNSKLSSEPDVWIPIPEYQEG